MSFEANNGYNFIKNFGQNVGMLSFGYSPTPMLFGFNSFPSVFGMNSFSGFPMMQGFGLFNTPQSFPMSPFQSFPSQASPFGSLGFSASPFGTYSSGFPTSDATSSVFGTGFNSPFSDSIGANSGVHSYNVFDAVEAELAAKKAVTAKAVQAASATLRAETDDAISNRFESGDKKDLGPEFLAKVKDISAKLNCDYRDFLAVMSVESAGINPQAAYRNKSGRATAVGLMQFTQVAVDQMNRTHGMDLTLDKILNMSGMEQLDLIEKHLIAAKKMAGYSADAKLSGGDLYAINFLPGRAKRDVLTSKGEAFYDHNPLLDHNKDGKITKDDLNRLVSSRRVDESRFA